MPTSHSESSFYVEPATSWFWVVAPLHSIARSCKSLVVGNALQHACMFEGERKYQGIESR